MKTIKGIYWNISHYFTYEINGKEYYVEGELYYNKSKKRFEHTHIGPRGGETLIYWTEKEYVK